MQVGSKRQVAGPKKGRRLSNSDERRVAIMRVGMLAGGVFLIHRMIFVPRLVLQLRCNNFITLGRFTHLAGDNDEDAAMGALLGCY